MAKQRNLQNIIILIALGLYVISCSQPYAQSLRLERNEPASVGDDYIIGSGDVLEVQVWRNEALSKVVVVRPDGKISLPLIGEVKAVGMTALQLRDRIIEKLQELVTIPEVTVIVREINSFVVYVLGEVQSPGKLQLNGRTTVVQAIAMAGGFKEFASQNKMILLRKVEGQYTEHRIKIKYDDIISGKVRNIWLQAGDTLIVP